MNFPCTCMTWAFRLRFNLRTRFTYLLKFAIKIKLSVIYFCRLLNLWILYCLIIENGWSELIACVLKQSLRLCLKSSKQPIRDFSFLFKCKWSASTWHKSCSIQIQNIKMKYSLITEENFILWIKINSIRYLDIQLCIKWIAHFFSNNTNYIIKTIFCLKKFIIKITIEKFERN